MQSNFFTTQTKIVIAGIFVLFAALYFIKGYAYLDSDFGWHIRMGEYVLTHGIPKTDPLSYTMPDYPMVDLEWITNILFVFVDTHFAMTGLSILLTILCFAAIFLQAAKRHFFLFLLPAFLACAILFEPFGVRTQVISWLFFSVLVKVIYDHHLWQKFRYLVPILMLIWANMHGSFLLGNVVLVLYGGSLLLSKKAKTGDLLLIGIAIAATLINPYGFRLWHEVWVQSTDENLHWVYGEWMPILFDLHFAEFMYFILFFVLIFRYYKKFAKFQLFLTILLFAAGCSSIRNIPFFVLASLPLVTQGLVYIYADIKNYLYREKRSQKYYAGVFIIIILSILGSTYANLVALISHPKDALYPVYAVEYLQKHIPKGNMLSVFEWGGYLDLYVPQKKVFIDGRMDNWRLANPGTSESTYIYGENKMLGDRVIPVAAEVKKYHITTVLYYSPKQTNGKSLPYYYHTLIDLYKGHKSYAKYPPIPVQLRQDGFTIVYQDNLAAVYEKK